MKFYPIVIIPQEIEKIFVSIPVLPIPPIEPIKPTYKIPEKPTPPIPPVSFIVVWGFGILIIGIFMLLIFASQKFKFIETLMREFPPLGIALIVGVIFAIKNIIEYHNGIDKTKLEYQNLLSQYELDQKKYLSTINNYENQFNVNLKHYENKLYPKFLEEIDEFENIKSIILSESNIFEHRKNLIREYFKKTKYPSKIDNIYLTGVSELDFFNFLLSKSKNFYRGFSIIEDERKERYYIPDIIYFDKSKGIVIDIEIDEPYLGSDGTPIHYEGYDDYRNNFFIENGWIIIRFAEEQVVLFPDECWIFIEMTICKILNAENSMIVTMKNQVAIWTKDEAHKLAFKRHRNSYLKNNLIENIRNELLAESEPIFYSDKDDEELPF